MNDTVERAAPEVFVLLDSRDHEPVDVALAERDLGRRGHRVVRYVLPTAPASSSAEIEVLAAVSNRLLAMTREPGQLGTVYDGFWSARNMVDAMLTEVRARQSQLRVDPTQARTVPRASIGLHAPEAAQSAEPAGDVEALLREAATFATPLYCAHRHGQVPRMVADLAKALRASEAERDNAGKTILQLCEHQETKLSELRAKLEQAEERAAKLDAALVKVNCIRNSIVGMQGFNFSEHAYPLVAALDEAGYEGLPYPEARANLGTLIEQTKRAEERAEQAEAARAEAERKLDETRRDLTEVMSERDSARFDLANTKHNLECARTGERQIVQAIRDACDGLGITEDEPQIVRVRLLRAERDEARARLDAAEAELTQLHDELQTFADEEFGPFPTEPCLELVRLIRKYTFERRKADAERRAALDVAVPVDVEALAGIAYRILFPAARDEPLPKREESHYFAACCDIARTTAQHVARAMMTERVLTKLGDAICLHVGTVAEKSRAGMRAAMTEALGGGVLPSDADGAEAVARLGIDVPQWAAEVREMVATAIHCKCGCAWRKHADGTLSLWDQNQRPCAKCDNGPIAEVEPERRPCPVDEATLETWRAGATSSPLTHQALAYLLDEAERARGQR